MKDPHQLEAGTVVIDTRWRWSSPSSTSKSFVAPAVPELQLHLGFLRSYRHCHSRRKVLASSLSILIRDDRMERAFVHIRVQVLQTNLPVLLTLVQAEGESRDCIVPCHCPLSISRPWENSKMAVVVTARIQRIVQVRGSFDWRNVRDVLPSFLVSVTSLALGLVARGWSRLGSADDVPHCRLSFYCSCGYLNQPCLRSAQASS